MQYSGFWRRDFASAIDALILTLPMILLNAVLPFLAYIFCTLLYRPFFESSPLQATPGKALMGIAIVNEADGGRISLRTALIRTLLTYISSAILGIGYIISLFTEKRQTLHDLLTQTVVIRRIPIEVNFFDVWWNEVKPLLDSSKSISATTNPEVSTKTLEELYKLYQSGAITESDYLQKKDEILKKI